jgi:hypothetical protein
MKIPPVLHCGRLTAPVKTEISLLRNLQCSFKTSIKEPQSKIEEFLAGLHKKSEVGSRGAILLAPWL